MKKLFKTKPAFNLTELLVVIFILALIGSLAIVSFNEVRKSGRDSKRLADVSEMKMVLENYKFFEGEYPSELIPGQPLIGPTTGNVYLDPVPSNLPYANDDCPYEGYTYTREDGYYTISFCLERRTENHNPGTKCFISASGQILDSACSFTCGEDVVYGGSTYLTVQIGDQCWFAQDLMYDNGCSSETYVNYTDVGWCSPPFYQWSAAMNNETTEGAQGLCPANWHVATLADFQTLSATLGGDSVSGSKLKASSPFWDGSNEAGFNALPAGYIDGDGSSYYAGMFNFTHTSSFPYPGSSHYINMMSGISSTLYTEDLNSHSRLVRCVKD